MRTGGPARAPPPAPAAGRDGLPNGGKVPPPPTAHRPESGDRKRRTGHQSAISLIDGLRASDYGPLPSVPSIVPANHGRGGAGETGRPVRASSLRTRGGGRASAGGCYRPSGHRTPATLTGRRDGGGDSDSVRRADTAPSPHGQEQEGAFFWVGSAAAAIGRGSPTG